MSVQGARWRTLESSVAHNTASIRNGHSSVVARPDRHPGRRKHRAPGRGGNRRHARVGALKSAIVVFED
jgi:hypothetical protein